MSWITLTEADVLTRLSSPELTALKSAAKGVGQADPLPEIIEQVTDKIRGYCAAHRQNQLGDAGTLPPRLVSTALVMIRYELATRLPGMGSLIDALRQKEYDTAIDLLKAVAKGDFALTDPDDTTDETSPAPTPRTSAKTRADLPG